MKNKSCEDNKTKEEMAGKVLFWTRFLKIISCLTVIVAAVLGVGMGMEFGGIKSILVFLIIFCPALLLVGCVMVYLNATLEMHKIYYSLANNTNIEQ